jgi:hypothetical protein
MTSAISNVPVVSIFADMIGTQLSVRFEFLKVISRVKSTCDLDFSVDLLGRMRTSLKSSLMSLMILMVVFDSFAVL